MKKIVWQNPNKMEIHTGHKTFDKKCVVIREGNVFSDTQTSCYIRPRTEIECNGFTNPEGYLRDFDLHAFVNTQPGIPRHVLDRVIEETKDKQICLYRIFHYIGEKRIMHGWILTKSYQENHELITVFHSNFRSKSLAVMNEVVQYVSNPPKETQKIA